MKIAIFAKRTLIHGLGGLEVHLEALTRELSVLGHDVHVITTRHPNGVEEERHHAQFHFLPGAASGRYSREWWRLARRAFVQLSDPEPFKLVLSLGLGARAICSLVPRPPIYFICHGLVLSHLAVEWKQCHRLRDFVRFFAVTLPELLVYAWGIERSLLRNADGVIAVSDQLAKTLQGRASRVIVAYNGVSSTRFIPDPETRRLERKRLGLADEQFVILMASTMIEQKGMHLGLRALRRLVKSHPNLRLLLAGTGPQERVLRRMAERPSLRHRCHFLGPISHKAMPALLQAADCFLHPSLRAEGLPTVILEAMASGLPVVASDSAGGTATIVINERTGLMVSPGAVNQIAEALDRLLRDHGLRMNLANEARAMVHERFSWPVIIKQMMSELTSPASDSTHVPSAFGERRPR